jgi:hypothetical protein
MADSLAQVARDLYGVAPADFIAARTDRAATVDDRELAAGIARLRRAAPAAWVVNLLARDREDELEQLFALGSEARTAQSALDRTAITDLSRRRRDLVRDLARAGGDLAQAAGHPVGAAVLAAVAGTLDAGAADPEAADAIRSGRLVRALETIGFEPVDLAGAVAVPDPGGRAAAEPPARPRPRAVVDPDRELERARVEAQQTLAAAGTRAAEADAALADVVDRAAELEVRRRRLEDELTELEARTREAREALTAVEREDRALDRNRIAATREAERAATALETATRRRAELGG